MHHFAAVVVPPDVQRDEVEPYVEKAMSPHIEEWDGEEKRGFWDWWQVGGRWTGVWGEYDPQQDPANIETCRVCGGAGLRPDAARFENETPGWTEHTGGCNGCRGKGTCMKWPTEWRSYDGDIIKVAALLNNPLQRPITVVLPDGTAVERERWTGEEWTKQTDDEWEDALAEALTPHRDQALVAVDYHS